MTCYCWFCKIPTRIAIVAVASVVAHGCGAVGASGPDDSCGRPRAASFAATVLPGTQVTAKGYLRADVKLTPEHDSAWFELDKCEKYTRVIVTTRGTPNQFLILARDSDTRIVFEQRVATGGYVTMKTPDGLTFVEVNMSNGSGFTGQVEITAFREE